MKKMRISILILAGLISGAAQAATKTPALRSFDTGYTITKVRTAETANGQRIIASSYEGTVLAMDFEGQVLWTNSLSGFVNHDVWCADLDGDGNDEILTANGDGRVYCLDADGELQWQFQQNEVPMYAVCAVRNGKESYIACGGFDLNMYYLDAKGALIETVSSSSYSQQKVWHKASAAKSKVHCVNFLRPLPKADGGESLAMIGFNNHMQDGGTLYEFGPLNKRPNDAKGCELKKVKTLGDMHLCDTNGDGIQEALFGTSQHMNTSALGIYDFATQKYRTVNLAPLRRKIKSSHYLVTQPRTIPAGDSFQYFLLMGRVITLLDPDLNVKNAEVISTRYSYNDLWQVGDSKFLIASSQSGGSCIHLLDTAVKDWKTAYEQLDPPGHLAQIKAQRATLEEQVAAFKRPAHEVKGRARPIVYFMTESLIDPAMEKKARRLEQESAGLQFLNNKYTNKAQYPPSWDRDTVVTNAKYRKARDSRHDYKDPRMDQAGIVKVFAPTIDEAPKGVAYWGGHGNDPLFFSLETREALVERAWQDGGKKTVQIFPEMEHVSADFEWVVNNMFGPFADFCKTRNANIYLRSKNISWAGNVYHKTFEPGSDKLMWDKLLSGAYADVFVPSMEETTDKTMEISLAGRMGLWGSGAVNSWGTRAVRDNPCYDRSRQHANQMLPNHFLVNLVFHIANGAQYINNFPVDQEYSSILWDLIASGVLYVPHRDEILSINPVHLSMHDPDPRYMHEAHESKWNTCYDAEEEAANPMVFGRMNSTWMGAKVTEWDYASYAAGVKERRLNFIAPFPHGVVLITPPQKGAFADKNAPRGKLIDHLHPFYKKNMKEVLTNGHDYLSQNGQKHFAADSYGPTVAKAVAEQAKLLPLTVQGQVGWVTAQSGPKHLRLTLVDSGYINPKSPLALVQFQTVKTRKVTNLLTGEVIAVDAEGRAEIQVPLGSFSFLDIELAEAL